MLVVLKHGGREEIHHGLFNDVVKGAGSFCAQKQSENFVAFHHISDSHGEDVVALHVAWVIDTGLTVQATNVTLVQNERSQGFLAGASFQGASRSVATDGSIRVDVCDEELDPSKIPNGCLKESALLHIIASYSVEEEDVLGDHIDVLKEGLIELIREAARIGLVNTSVLFQLEEEDVLERYLSVAVGFHELGESTK